MSTVVLEAKKREALGTSNSRRFRRDGMTPGVFYHHGEDAMPLVFDSKALTSFVNHARGLVDLALENEKKPLKCVVKDIQYHPITEEVVHIDLLGVKMGEKLQIAVPIVFDGTPVGLKQGGVLQQILRELNIECLPKNIPDNLHIDISELGIGDSIHISDLSFDNVEILNDPSEAVALVELAKAALAEAEEEEVDEEAAVEDGEETEESTEE